DLETVGQRFLWWSRWLWPELFPASRPQEFGEINLLRYPLRKQCRRPTAGLKSQLGVEPTVWIREALPWWRKGSVEPGCWRLAAFGDPTISGQFKSPGDQQADYPRPESTVACLSSRPAHRTPGMQRLQSWGSQQPTPQH